MQKEDITHVQANDSEEILKNINVRKAHKNNKGWKKGNVAYSKDVIGKKIWDVQDVKVHKEEILLIFFVEAILKKKIVSLKGEGITVDCQINRIVP